MARDRTLTSFPALETDTCNAGGEWVKEEVVTNQSLVTSRGPDDVPALCSNIVEEFAEGEREEQVRSA